MLDNTVVPLSTAAEVSSHDDSMAKIYSFISIFRKDKNTKKTIIHSILIIITVIFALLASLYVVILDVNVQSMLARTVAGFLSNKFNTEVKIRTFYIKPDLRIHAEEVQFNDKMHQPMFYVGKLDAKLSLRDLANELRVASVNVDDVLVNIVKYEDSYTTNVSELFSSSDKSESDSKSKMSVFLDELNLSRGHVVVWNQSKDKPGKTSMDYGHLDIDSINLFVKNIAYNGDTITGRINHLSAMDKCGFDLDEFSSPSTFIVSSNGLNFKNLTLKTHATALDLDLQFLYNGYSNFKDFVDSIMIVANFRPSQITLSDLKYFSGVMGKMTDTLQISGMIIGTVSDFVANRFSFSFKDSTNFLGTIKMKGLPNFYETHIVGEVNKMNFTYQDISEFAIPTPSRKIPLPEFLSSMQNAVLSGQFFGFHNNFNTNFNLHTNLGNINFDGALNNDDELAPLPYYFFKVHANNVNVKEILGMKDELTVSFEADMSGEGLTKNDIDAQMSLDFGRIKALNNEFRNVAILGDIENQRFVVSTNVDSDILKLDLEAMMDVSDSSPAYDAKINVKKADLYKLNLLDNDEKMVLSTNINAKLSGNDIDKIYGNVCVDNTKFTDSRGEYFMDTLNLALTKNHFDSKDIKVSCDFFDVDVNGIFNFRNIGNSFKNYVMNHFHVNKWTDKGLRLNAEPQDFYVNLVLKNTETLSRLLMPGLKVSENTSLTATFTSSNYQLHSTLESEKITYNKFIFNDLYVKNKTDKNKATANISLKEFIIKESSDKNPVGLGLENLELAFDAHNDSLMLDFNWNDVSLDDKNKGSLNAMFLSKDKTGGVLHVTSSDVIINDSLWNISPTCYVNFNKNKITFDEFDIFSGNQSVKIRGCFPKTSNDTINLEFNNLNISDFDLLTAGYGIDVDGYIAGELQLAGVSDKFTFFSDLDVNDLGVNGHVVGNATVNASWNATDTSIFVDAEIVRNDNFDRVFSMIGNYYTSRDVDNLDFVLDLNDIDISLVNSFTKGVISRVKGNLDGNFVISGSMKKPVLAGDAVLNNAACNIDYLNTYYKINPSGRRGDNLSHYIRFSENRIDFDDIILVDTLDNQAVAKGYITHDYLKDFRFNVEASLDNFLGMNMLPDDASSFYGTAIANGDLKINGPLDDIVIDIDAQSMPGTVIDIRLISTTSVNDNFIVFIDKNETKDTTNVVERHPEKDRKFTLNLNADVTEDADVNIHLPSNMGNINANGSGNIRLGYAFDQLSLYGDYVINEGTFVFNFQNLVRRNFDIKQGGTISWTGDAADADINVVGSYNTKSSITSLGVEIDSTSLVSNVNVDCILRLQEKLTNPTITFGLALPNATDDIKNMVFSIIDTTNQAVMSQQIISLLVLGSFSYSNASLYSIGASNYYNVLTSSLSSWLSQISKDFDVGVRYTPEDNLTAEELEVALSTQLFNDRLTIEGNFGMYTGNQNEMAGGFNNFVGDFDITYKINNRFSFKIYNHSNLSSNYYTYSYEAYSDYTQGVGLSYSQSFDNIREIFARKNRNKKNKTVKKRQK